MYFYDKSSWGDIFAQYTFITIDWTKKVLLFFRLIDYAYKLLQVDLSPYNYIPRIRWVCPSMRRDANCLTSEQKWESTSILV